MSCDGNRDASGLIGSIPNAAPDAEGAADWAADCAAAARSRPRPAGGLATLVAIVTSILGVIVLAWAVLYITKGRFLKHPFERIVGKFSDRKVVVGGDFQLYFDPIDLKFRAENMTIDNPAWAGPRKFYTGKLIDARLKTFASIFGKKRLDSLVLDGTAIDLEWSKDHTLNTWTFSDDPTPIEIPIIQRGQVSGTTLRYRDPKLLIAADIKVDTVEAKDTRFASAVRFSGGGTARICTSVSGSMPCSAK